MIVKEKGIASEIVLDIINVMEKTNENEYVHIEQSFWEYPYDQHFYISVFNDITKKDIRVIEYKRIKKNEAYGVIRILKDMGNDYEKISKHFGELYNYKKDCWIVEKGKDKYGLRYKKDLLPRYYFENKVKAKIICNFLNQEGIK